MNSTWGMSGWDLLTSGGPIMVPILLCSLIATAIVIEKIWYLASISTHIPNFRKELFELLRNNKIKEAITLCDQNHSPISKILQAGILKSGISNDAIKEAMENISLQEIPKLEARLGLLASLAHVAPLLGLLGTVIGLMNAFHALQVKAATLTPTTTGDLAGGIWQALITTVAGLTVAIPAYLAMNYCVGQVHRVILEMERGAGELLQFFSQLNATDAAHKLKNGEEAVEI